MYERQKERLIDERVMDDERVAQFTQRNLTDNRHSSRVIHSLTMQLYPESYEGGTIVKDGTQRVFTNPGRITALLRHQWLRGAYYKYRDDDRQHAMDALIVALVTPRRLKQLTSAYQKIEKTGKKNDSIPIIPKPWRSFTEDAINEYNSDWLVCRTEHRRASGALHAETIRRNPGKTSVRVNSRNMGGKSGDDVGGYADQPSGSIVRTDVFYVDEERIDPSEIPIEKGYHLVPVYRWDVLSRKKKQDRKGSVIRQETPRNAVVAKVDTDKWPEMHPDDFVFSLYPGSYVEVLNADETPFFITRRDEKRTRVRVAGYFRSTNIHLDSIKVSPHNDHRENKKGQSPSMIDNIRVKRRDESRKNTIVIKKYQVDRFGTKHEIVVGTEQWKS